MECDREWFQPTWSDLSQLISQDFVIGNKIFECHQGHGIAYQWWTHPKKHILSSIIKECNKIYKQFSYLNSNISCNINILFFGCSHQWHSKIQLPTTEEKTRNVLSAQIWSRELKLLMIKLSLNVGTYFHTNIKNEYSKRYILQRYI